MTVVVFKALLPEQDEIPRETNGHGADQNQMYIYLLNTRLIAELLSPALDEALSTPYSYQESLQTREPKIPK